VLLKLGDLKDRRLLMVHNKYKDIQVQLEIIRILVEYGKKRKWQEDMDSK